MTSDKQVTTLQRAMAEHDKDMAALDRRTLQCTNTPGPFIITFYKLLCPQCKTITVGDDVYDNWREGQGVTCGKCELTSMPEVRKVDLNT